MSNLNTYLHAKLTQKRDEHGHLLAVEDTDSESPRQAPKQQSPKRSIYKNLDDHSPGSQFWKEASKAPIIITPPRVKVSPSNPNEKSGTVSNKISVANLLKKLRNDDASIDVRGEVVKSSLFKVQFGPLLKAQQCSVKLIHEDSIRLLKAYGEV